jgi:hypothetical protein
MGSAVLSVKHSFTPPSGCTWMYTLGLCGAGRHSAMYPAALAASRKEKPRPRPIELGLAARAVVAGKSSPRRKPGPIARLSKRYRGMILSTRPVSLPLAG